MMDLWIPFPEEHQALVAGAKTTGEHVEGDIFRLTSFASTLPLAPDDLVVVHDGDVVDVHQLTDAWIFQVYVNTPQMITAPGLDNPDNWDLDGLDDASWAAARLTADMVETELARATYVERATKHTLLLATPTRKWFDDYVRSPHILMFETVRAPGQVVDLQHELDEIYAERPMTYISRCSECDWVDFFSDVVEQVRAEKRHEQKHTSKEG